MSRKQPEKRIEYIDIAKGIGILLVIIGHAFRDEMRVESGLAEFVYQLVYFFHMPLFFVISGLTFGLSYGKYTKSPMQYVKRRVQTQFVPVLMYASVIYVCFFVAYQIPVFRQALSATGYQMYPYPEYLKLSALQNNPYSIHLWYLWILFIFSNIAYFYFRWASHHRWADVVFAAGALILYPLAAACSMPAILERICENLVYFAAGILLSSRHQISCKSQMAKAFTVFGWLFMLVYCVLCGIRYRMEHSVVFALCQLMANGWVIGSILRLSRKLGNCKPLLYCGRESYAIYLLHQPFCCGFVGVLLYNKFQWPALVVYVLCCVLSILLPAAAVAICRRVKPIGKLAKFMFNLS